MATTPRLQVDRSRLAVRILFVLAGLRNQKLGWHGAGRPAASVLNSPTFCDDLLRCEPMPGKALTTP